jgi:hypothetical protein
MNKTADQPLYEAKIRIGNKIISTVTGNSISDLRVFLSGKCELEKSGAKGEIIELSTGEVVYRCNRQTIIDE